MLLTACLVDQFLTDFTVLVSRVGGTLTKFVNSSDIAVDFFGDDGKATPLLASARNSDARIFIARGISPTSSVASL